MKMEDNINKVDTEGKSAQPFVQTYFHGTKAELNIGDLIQPGYNSNFGHQKNAKYIFLTAHSMQLSGEQNFPSVIV